MEGKLVHCPKCNRKVNYYVREVEKEELLKGEIFSYLGKDAHCALCGNDLSVPDVEQENRDALGDAFRERHGIISREHILEIPEKYRIGKRPLSLLLGWGEMTYTRYCEGFLPSKQYSDVLEKIYNNPVGYLFLLEKNKENLKSKTAYEKSKKAVMEQLAPQSPWDTMGELTANYLLNRCQDITPFALQKALYYIQGFYYAFTGDFLIAEECEAWDYGPVFPLLHNRYFDYHYIPAEKKAAIDEGIFTQTQKAIIDSVAEHICCYSGNVLQRFTCSEQPWIQARDKRLGGGEGEPGISRESIAAYFLAVKEKHNMLSPMDIKSYGQLMFTRCR